MCVCLRYRICASLAPFFLLVARMMHVVSSLCGIIISFLSLFQVMMGSYGCLGEERKRERKNTHGETEVRPQKGKRE